MKLKGMAGKWGLSGCKVYLFTNSETNPCLAIPITVNYQPAVWPRIPVVLLRDIHPSEHKTIEVPLWIAEGTSLEQLGVRSESAKFASGSLSMADDGHSAVLRVEMSAPETAGWTRTRLLLGMHNERHGTMIPVEVVAHVVPSISVFPCSFVIRNGECKSGWTRTIQIEDRASDLSWEWDQSKARQALQIESVTPMKEGQTSLLRISSKQPLSVSLVGQRIELIIRHRTKGEVRIPFCFGLGGAIGATSINMDGLSWHSHKPIVKEKGQGL